jgi:hypothetical protein
MVKTYRVTTYKDKATYTVSLDDSGVVDVDGLFPETAEALKTTVSGNIERRSLSPITALQVAIGSYSFLEEVSDDSVADSA